MLVLRREGGKFLNLDRGIYRHKIWQTNSPKSGAPTESESSSLPSHIPEAAIVPGGSQRRPAVDYLSVGEQMRA